MSTASPKRILLACNGDAARSLLAAALVNHLGGGRFAATATAPSSLEVHPLVQRSLVELKLASSVEPHEVLVTREHANAGEFDLVVAMYDEAAGEPPTDWLNQTIDAHWNVPDPAVAEGSEEHRHQAFVDVAVLLKRHIELMLALPTESLDQLGDHHQASGSEPASATGH